jgi:hypothetical protein
MHTKFLLGNLKERECLEEQGIDERIKLKIHFKETGCMGVDWIQLTQGRVQWQAAVIMVMNL